ncbi:MAG: PAS domain S-box protein, partial [Acidimicrobiia bacterium]|nr:PAS domain S-box protein [Acidimicrobiia bacterium]
TFAEFRYFIRQRDRARTELKAERHRSDQLLLNILPGPIADRLKSGESNIADRVDAVTVLFADLVGFTPLSAGMDPDQVVALLNDIFTTLDDLAQRHDLEKIKTIGDEYMVVGGLTTAKTDHVESTAAFALDVLDAFAEKPGAPQMRIGMQTGPVIAGVIGSTKFAYDLWGDTVNTASRMESHGVPGRIQVTSTVRDALVDSFTFEDRGPVEIKGKGLMETYFLVGRVTQSTDDSSL